MVKKQSYPPASINYLSNYLSVANLAALGCVRFCFLTFLNRKIWPYVNACFFRKRTNTVEVDFFKTIDATNAGLL